MQPQSDRARAALSQSHVVTAWADVLRRGSPTGTRLELGPGGSLDIDASSAVRRQGTVVVVDTDSDLLPLTDDGPIAPNAGIEVRVWQGLVYDDGDTETWSAGTLAVFEAVEGDWTSKGPTVDLRVFDRARVMSDRRLPIPYPIAAGASYATVIPSLLGLVYPGLPFRGADVDGEAPQTLVLGVGDDPFARCKDMALSIGCELYLDPMGVCVLAPVPDYATKPAVWSYTGSEDDSTLVSVQRALSREGAVSHVIVESNNVLGAVSGEATDDNPTSPTYIGTFGDVPATERLDYAAGPGACTAAAEAILRQRYGLAEVLSFEAIPNPAHEARDVVGVSDPESGASGTYVLDKFSLPLGPEGLLGGQPRARRVTR